MSDDPQKDEEKSEKPLEPVWFYAGLGATAVLGGITIWSGMDTNSARDEFDKNPTQSGLDDGRGKQSRTNVLLGATAVVGVATGVVAVFFTNFSGKKDHERAGSEEAHLGIGPGFVTVDGRF